MTDKKDTPQNSDVAMGQAKKEEKAEEKTNDVASEIEKKEEAPVKEEKSSEESKTENTGAEAEVPAKFKKLVEEVEKMTVLELNELVKVLEKKFGVSAQAVAVVAPGAGGDADGGEEQDSFTVELSSVGEQKIQVIKAVKEILGLGLKDAKDMVDGAPSVIKEGVKKAEAEEMKTKIEKAGGTVELK